MKIILPLILAFSLKAQILSNVRAYWKFDEPAPNNFSIPTSYADASGRGHTLTVNPNQKALPYSQPFRIGANASGAQTVTGSLAQWGKWNRLLTAGEKAAIAAGQTWPFSSTPSLQVGCVAYYLLNEASNAATYADATGRGNTLTRTGATTQVTGPGGTGHATSMAGATFLERNPPTVDLQSGNYNFTVVGWYNLAAKSNCPTCQQIFWGQVNIVTNPATTGAAVYYEGEGDSINSDLGNGVDLFANAAIVIPATQSSPTIGTWYQVLSEFNVTTSVMTDTINNTITATYPRNIQPPAVPAKINNGAHFVPNAVFVNGVSSGWDNSTTGPITRATAPSSPDLSFGNNAKTVWFWFKSDNTTTTQSVAGFYDFATNDIDWLVQIASGSAIFLIGNSAGTFDFCEVPFTDTSSFHLLVGWYDKAATTLHLNIDHGSLACSASVGLTPVASSLPLWIGANVNGSQSPGVSGASQPFLGAIDEMGIANGAATSTDLDTLWNSGAGITVTPSGAANVTMRGVTKARGFAVAK